MTILLQWLMKHAWIFYTVCAIGAVVYLVRALSAHRERGLALFTLEREVATARAVQSWAMVFVFIAIGVAVFLTTTSILPHLPAYTSATLFPTATPRAGVNPPTPGATVTPTEHFTLPTFAPATATVSVTPSPSPEPTESPPSVSTKAPVPTKTSRGPVSGELRVRFGDFGALVGYSLPSSDVTTSGSIELTLYWQGLEGSSQLDYVVFTHLLSKDGRLIAQHDGPPANGTHPTTGWAAGETIKDPHSMAFKQDLLGYTGPATIAVGLYDPSNPGARVQTETGGDRVVLPIAIDVVSEPTSP